jgi:hypothetical protein
MFIEDIKDDVNEDINISLALDDINTSIRIEDLNITLPVDDNLEKELKKIDDEIKNSLIELDKLNDIDEDELTNNSSFEIYNNIFSQIDKSNINDMEKSKYVDVTPVAYININTEELSKVKVNDIVELPFLGTSNYSSKIIDKKVFKNGDISLFGKLENESDIFDFIITIGHEAAFGVISTPDGSYEIETYNGNGYLLDVAEINKLTVTD